jgi:hypothetical protein
MLAALKYTNQGATRNMKLDAGLEAKIREAVGAVYGKDYVADVYSGGQAAKGTGTRRTGSTRHDLGNAADIYVRDPMGNKVTGDGLAPLAQYWQAKEYGGTGLEMRGGGIHLDQHTDRARFWDYSKQKGRITPAQLEAVRAGQRGVMPDMAGVDMTTTGSIAAQQAQEQAQQAMQAQIEAQKRLAEQMAATQQAAQAMTPPIQNIGQAATQIVPNLGGVTQGMTGLIGPLTQAIPGLGQFSGAIQQLLQQFMSGIGGGGLFGGLLGFKEGGEISGPGTGTSDSIPILASDGEYMVNAKSAKKHRRLLDAINSGHVPAFAAGGSIRGGTFAPSTTYAPSMSFNVTGSGNQRQDAALAGMIAAQVDRSLDKHKPDSFRRSQAQALTKQAQDMQRAGSRNG